MPQVMCTPLPACFSVSLHGLLLSGCTLLPSLEYTRHGFALGLLHLLFALVETGISPVYSTWLNFQVSAQISLSKDCYPKIAPKSTHSWSHYLLFTGHYKNDLSYYVAVLIIWLLPKDKLLVTTESSQSVPTAEKVPNKYLLHEWISKMLRTNANTAKCGIKWYTRGVGGIEE